MKKGQFEILGLAIVVILVSLAVLFILRFVVLEKPTEYKKEFSQSELAANVISTMLKTANPGCHNLKFSELFQNCAEDPVNPSIQCSITHNSCGYLSAALDDLFRDSLEEWNTPFYFKSQTNRFGESPIIEKGNQCPGEKKSKQFPIPVDPSGSTILYITLDICG